MKKKHVNFILGYMILAAILYSRELGDINSAMALEADVSTSGEPLSSVDLHIQGGRSPVKEAGIKINEYEDKIVINVFQRHYRAGNPNEIDKEGILSYAEYRKLWKKLEALKIWDLKTTTDRTMLDSFTYVFEFKKGKEINQFSVNGLSALKPYVEVADAINELAGKKMSFWLYPKRNKDFKISKSFHQTGLKGAISK